MEIDPAQKVGHRTVEQVLDLLPSSGMPGNPQATVSRFFGREAELGRVQSLLSRGERLVTLCGEGGAGKTRIALEVLPDLGPYFIAGAWFCDASRAGSDEELLRVVAGVLAVDA